MSYIVRAKINPAQNQAWTVNRQALSAQKPKQLDVVTRRYEIDWLNSDGSAESKTRVAPAMQVFEQAFGAFAQGALIQTDKGYSAIEDLSPGDMIATADAGLQKLQWIGSMTLYPQSLELGVPSSQLFRITDGGYGQDPNAPDLMMGPSARILAGVMAIDSSSPLISPQAMADGGSVIGINPVSPVRVFHLGLARHSILRANGVLAESYHPGPSPHTHMPTELYPHFMSLFPHIESIEEFGRQNHQRN
jgi:hypothetical protein